MSIGAPSNLGTLLIQRLDAALGTTLGQQSNLASGAGPQAVPQPANPENPNTLQNQTQRHPREAVDQANQQGRQQAAVGKAMRDMRLDNLLGRSTTFQGTTQSAPTTLGYAARIILALLNQFPQDGQAVRGQSPLLPNPGTGQTAGQGQAAGTAAGPAGNAAAPPASAPPALAGGVAPTWGQLATALGQPGALAARFSHALTQSVQTSGLFYESHLAQLAAGKTTPQTLRQEPQGRLPTSLPAQMQQAAQQTASGNPAAASSTPDTPQGNQPAHQAPMAPGIDPQAQLLVRQQLEVLANQHFIWQGEAWPGADMEWEIRRRHQNDDEAREFEGEHWSTSLNLHLPALGQVQARLSLSGDQLVMRLVAPESADRLGQAIEPLRARLLAQGLQASQLSVLAQDDSNASSEDARDDEITPS